MNTTTQQTGETCHCGASMRGSDHCPECYCEAFERYCEEDNRPAGTKLFDQAVQAFNAQHSLYYGGAWSESEIYRGYVRGVADGALEALCLVKGWDVETAREAVENEAALRRAGR